jgi:hypothetical protein
MSQFATLFVTPPQCKRSGHVADLTKGPFWLHLQCSHVAGLLEDKEPRSPVAFNTDEEKRGDTGGSLEGRNPKRKILTDAGLQVVWFCFT